MASDKKEKRLGPGQPTKYRKEYDRQAYRHCLLGATDDDLAALFDVNVWTIHEWKKAQPSFLKALREGKEEADAKVAESMYRASVGYSHEDVHVSNYQGQITLTPLTKHYPPDTRAASLWLRNRQPRKWRDKTAHELTGPDGGPMQVEEIRRTLIDPDKDGDKDGDADD